MMRPQEGEKVGVKAVGTKQRAMRPQSGAIEFGG